MSSRSKSPKPESAREAKQLMNDRFAEYQKKREARLKEKAQQEEEERERRRRSKDPKVEEILRREEERRKNRGRSFSPMPTERRAARSTTRKPQADESSTTTNTTTASSAPNKHGSRSLSPGASSLMAIDKKVKEEEARKRKEEADKLKAEAEEKKRLEEAAKLKIEAEKKRQEEADKLDAEAEEKKRLEEEAKREAEEQQAKRLAAEKEAQAKKDAAEILTKKNAAKDLAKNKPAEQQAEKKAKAAEQQAQKKVADARLQKWKEQEQKRKAQAAKTYAENKEAPVERVPKLSALLAMGGPEAEEYKKTVARARLATWKSNAGDRWEILQQTFDGRSLSEVTKEEVVVGIPIEEAIETFQNNPEKYIAMHYFMEQLQKQPAQTEYTFILREGTVGYEPQNTRTDGGGRLVIWRHIYKRLEPFTDNVLPPQSRDKYTDVMTFSGKKLHTDGKDKNRPILPGRGMGLGDEANMEMIGEFAQPSHVRQGACVGDCWLLSAIACLADFDWAVKRLFRKTTSPSLEQRPQDKPNQYTVTLWDLKTWKEVDVVVDERLPVRADGTGYLLGAKPSKDGKYWVPYLEKAIAAHCGGYDKLNGGNCTDAWPMMTGSRNQFVITKNPKTQKYYCGAKYNPQDQKWTEHSNSPHDHNPAIWRVDWPLVGGGGDSEFELNEDELFRRVVAWDENNYLIGAATSGRSDKKSTDGIVDNHAYSVIDSRQNICGIGIDLLLIRNPWGEGGELKNGQFMRSGPGWDRYPEIKKELNPSMDDNGLCWVTKKEFFRYFPTLYLCAFNMTRLQDDKYVNDLEDHFKRRPKTTAKPKPAAPTSNDDEFGPIHVNKSSDPSSPYKIVEESFNGGVAFSEINQKVIKGASIATGVDEFRANPGKYLAIHYQTNMVEEGWPVEMHQFTFVYRDGTEGLEIDPVKGGKRTMLTNVLR